MLPFLLLITSLLTCAKTFKILLLPGNIGSHLIIFGRLAEDLLLRGHDVIMVTGSRTSIPEEVRNLRRLQLETFNQKSRPFTELKEYKQPLIKSAFTESTWDMLSANGNLFRFHIKDGLFLLQDIGTMEKLKRWRFDFAVVDYVVPSFYIVPYQLNLTFAILGLSPPVFLRRMPFLPSYVPTPTSFYSDNMGFKQRLINFAHTLYFAYIQRPWNGKDLVSQFVPEKPVLGFGNLVSQARLFITIRDVLFQTPRPLTPDTVFMGNLMSRPANRLPSLLEDFMTSSQHGIIVVSFGSWLDDLPPQTICKMLEAFRNVKQNILWKYSGNIPGNIPQNVKIVRWFQQNDVLGHPKVRLFVNHGGLNSLIEAVYHRVPMVLFPIGIDQYTNSALAVDKGIAVVLPIGGFTSSDLLNSMNTVLNNTMYNTNINELSVAMKEMIGAKTANPGFWIEHVIKHGSTHVRSRAFDLPWYQWLMLDVLLVVSLCLYVVKRFLFDCVFHRFKCYCIVTYRRYRASVEGITNLSGKT